MGGSRLLRWLALFALVATQVALLDRGPATAATTSGVTVTGTVDPTPSTLTIVDVTDELGCGDPAADCKVFRIVGDNLAPNSEIVYHSHAYPDGVVKRTPFIGTTDSNGDYTSLYSFGGCSSGSYGDFYLTGTGADGQPIESRHLTPCGPSGGGGDPGGGGGTGVADLELAKEGPESAVEGEELTYRIRVKNNGPDPATDVTVNDTLPSGLQLVSVTPGSPTCQGTVTIVCNVGTLAVGEIATVVIVARAVVAGPVDNDATASANEADGNLSDNSASWGVGVEDAPAMGLAKGARVLPGPRIEYTIDVENLGPTVAHNVVAKDVLSPGWTLLELTTTHGVCNAVVECAIGTLAVGEKATVKIVVGVVVNEPVDNEVELTWGGGGRRLTASASTAPFPDLRVSKAHVGDLVAGQSATYTVSVSNVGGGSTTEPIVVVDTLPTGMSFSHSVGGEFDCSADGRVVTCTRTAPLAGGSSTSFVLHVNVSPDAPANLTNYVTVRGGGGTFQDEPFGDGGSVVPPTSLGVQKRVDKRTVTVGANLTYLIDVTNTGNRRATNVQVIDTLPAGAALVSVVPGAPTCTGTSTITCAVGDLEVGETYSVEIVVAARDITVLTNEVLAFGDGIAPTRSGSVSTEVTELPTLSLDKEASEPLVLQDSTLRYTITARNLGPGAATDVAITDPLPTGVTLLSVLPDTSRGMTCNVTGPFPMAAPPPVTCVVPELAAAQAATVVLTVRVQRVGELSNTAVVHQAGDPDVGATATEPVIVYANPASGQFTIGDRAPRGIGASVYFWGSQWQKHNPHSGGNPPSEYKGFHNGSPTTTCGSRWTSRPGNSSGPPASVPEYLAVVVSSRVTKSGSSITGDVREVVIVRTAPGYGPSPSQVGTGTVVAVLCRT